MKAIFGHLLEVLQPEISERNLTRTFDLKTDHALRNRHRRIIINENRHDVSINDVNHFIAAGNDVHLIPIISFDVSLEFIRIAEHCEQPGLLSLLGLHDLSSPGDDAAASSLLVKLTAVAPDIIKVRLIAFQIVFWVCRIWVLSAASLRRWCYRAAILDPAVKARPFQFHFQFQLKVLGLSAFPNNVGGARWFFGSGGSNDCAVFEPPNIHIPVPIFQAAAIEDRLPSFVIIERDWLRLREAASASSALLLAEQ